MKEEIYVLNNVDSFELKDIFECGQCFRWDKQEDGSYTGITKYGVINVLKKNNQIIFKGKIFKKYEFGEIIEDYFDLNTDYNKIKNILSKIDINLKYSVEFGKGIRILNQDFWETIISFIISANNNIPRIKKIINSISKKYGNKITWQGKEYYTFPSVENLSKASVEDFRDLGLGFRDIRVFNTTKAIFNNNFNLNEISNMKNTEDIRVELLKLDGVGPKVADCILLFSLHKFDVFPIDVWVRRVMNDLYIHNEKEEDIKKEEIKKLANEKFGKYQALAQQYLFYWRRENN